MHIFVPMDLWESISAMVDLVLPRTCAVCGRTLAVEERHLCSSCAADIPLTYNWNMATNEMADKFNALIQRDLEDSEEFVYEPYSHAAALFFYKSGSEFREITRQLKYHGNVGMGRWAAKLLAEKLAGSELYSDVDLVVPVPLHWSRYYRRGYNQAAIIAEVLAAELGAGFEPRILRRRRRTRTQTHLSVSEKTMNVAGAFALNPGKAEKHRGVHHVLLVDDVFTTGSTLNESRKALRTAFGPETRISIATLGYVGQ